MKKTDVEAKIEAIEMAPLVLPPDLNTYRKDDLERLVRNMDFSWAKGLRVKPLRRRHINIQEDHEGLYVEEGGEQLRGFYLILYIISGDKTKGMTLTCRIETLPRSTRCLLFTDLGMNTLSLQHLSDSSWQDSKFPLGKRICPNPTMFEYSFAPLFNSMTAFLTPSFP